jgi:hypothetical protein
MRMIIGRSLTSLNSSGSMRGIGRCDDNSRKKVRNVHGDSSEKRPEQRFQSAYDLAFDLEALSASSATTAPLITRRVMGGRRAVTVIALLLVGVGLAIVAERMLRATPPAEPPTYRRLTYERGSLGQARFAPDGNTVVYNAAWRGDPTGVFTIRLDSRESRPLGLSNATLHAVSSKSELALGLQATEAFLTRESLPSHATTLSRLPLAGGAPRDVLDRVTWADWSPDGSDLAVVRLLENSQRLEFPIGKVLYETNGNITHLRVSPQGDRLAFIDHPKTDPFSAGALVALDRSGARRTLSKDWGDAFGVAWRPDGGEVWFTAGKSGESSPFVRSRWTATNA